MIGGRRRKTALFSGLAAGALLGALAGCGSEGSSIPPAQVRDGNVLYQQNCAACHGERGAGSISVPLADPLYLALAGDDQLRETIARGRPTYQMGYFSQRYGGPLSDTQINALIGALRGYASATAPPPAAAPPLSPVGAPAGDATRGQQAYAQSCARCHGQNGEGGSGGAVRLPNVLALHSNELLRRLIITGLPAPRSMPDYAHLGGAPLTSEQVADLVALLASWRAGAAATPTSPASP